MAKNYPEVCIICSRKRVKVCLETEYTCSEECANELQRLRNTKRCIVCKNKNANISHHISYLPDEIEVPVHQSCHARIHGFYSPENSTYDDDLQNFKHLRPQKNKRTEEQLILEKERKQEQIRERRIKRKQETKEYHEELKKLERAKGNKKIWEY